METTAPQEPIVVVTKHGDVTVLAFNRPHAMNALVREMSAETHVQLRAAIADGARAIVLTGTGRAFSAGADLAYFSDVLQRGEDALPREVGANMKEVSNPLALALAQSPIPIVAAVNGPCVGGSVGLALAADICIASRSSYFLVPQVSVLGVMPDLGATWQYPHKVGRARALGAMLLGERISAERAESWGLIWRCVDDAVLLEEALGIANRLAKTPAATLQAARKLVDDAPNATLEEQLDAERVQQVHFLGTEPFRKAVARFLAK